MNAEKNSYIGQAWLVIVLGVLFGAALAGVHAGLAPKIEQNRLNDTLAQIPQLVPGAARGELIVGSAPITYRALDAGGDPIGWVLLASGQGFADRIQLLVGLDRDATRITGLYVLQQNETPGLGNRVTELRFRDQFKGVPAARAIRLVKGRSAGEGEVEAVTGATVSSQSVVAIVNAAVERFRQRGTEIGEQGSDENIRQ